MLERRAELSRHAPPQPGGGRGGDLCGNLLLEKGATSFLLPARKPAMTDRPLESSVTVDANELVGQRDDERLGVLPGHRARVIDLRLELESGLPEIAIVKEKARLELDLAEPLPGSGERPP